MLCVSFVVRGSKKALWRFPEHVLAYVICMAPLDGVPVQHRSRRSVVHTG